MQRFSALSWIGSVEIGVYMCLKKFFMIARTRDVVKIIINSSFILMGFILVLVSNLFNFRFGKTLNKNWYSYVLIFIWLIATFSLGYVALDFMLIL